MTMKCDCGANSNNRWPHHDECVSLVAYCIGCTDQLRDCDRDPNGDQNATCARCRAEEAHDFDAEPDVVFNRYGSRVVPLVPDFDDLLAAKVFDAHWPKGLSAGEVHQIFCDDKGRNGGTWLQVYLAGDSDVHVSMQDWEEIPEGQPTPFPSLHVRTFNGGGRNHRTHQALLWLAEAIRLDNEENKR